MLNVFYGREDIDKQRYLFARARAESLARGQDGSVLLIVPDQFTLETERAAFDYLEAPAFVDPVVTSMNRLAGRVLAETGGRTDYIDQYGKYMLIARLLHRGREALSVYRGLENSTAFIEKVSAAIMSFKTHLVTPDALASAVEAMEGDSLLRRKLVDLLWIYRGYEEALAAMDGGAGRPDSTDVTRLFAARIRASAFLRGAVVWVYGYDYISPLYTEAIAGMACVCAEVNVVLTAEPGDAFFALTNRTCEALCEAARAAGSEAAVHGIAEDGARRGVPCAYREKDARPEQIAHIERALFAYGGAGAPVFAGAAGEAGGVPPALRLVAARDFES
ncbi:MAG: hypothetical protein LBR44_03365, partial [Clostridiales Family XIII bacterium]|nr:hypothetical protein [Clostridiales Family XIII bacterium]